VAGALQLAPRAVRERRQRPGFYAVLVASTALALAASLAQVPVIGMLVI